MKSSISSLIVAYFDVHLDHTEGLWPPFRAFKQFCRDVQPDIGICGGDWLELSYLSKFNADTPLLVEGKRYQQDLDLGRRENEFLRRCFRRHIFIPGNHDYRITRFIERFPMFEGRMSIRRDYDLDNLSIECAEYNEIISVGKCNFMHGYKWNKYHAASNLQIVGDHIFYGHTHTQQTFCAPMRPGQRPYVAMGVGHLGNPNPYWKRNMASAWVWQFLLIEVAESGNFNPIPITITDGEFSYGGYTWRG